MKETTMVDGEAPREATEGRREAAVGSPSQPGIDGDDRLAEVTNAVGPADVAGPRSAGDDSRRAGVMNQHSFEDEEFEVDTAQNYHGVEDSA
jgi:hypothetical protein